MLSYFCYLCLLSYVSSVHNHYYFRVNKGRPYAKDPVALQPIGRQARREEAQHSEERGGSAGLAHKRFSDKGVSGTAYLQLRVSATQRRVTLCTFHFKSSQSPCQGGCWHLMHSSGSSQSLSFSLGRPFWLWQKPST